jgi:hypothetical protein
MAMYGTASLALAAKAINVPASIAANVFILFSVLLVAAPIRTGKRQNKQTQVLTPRRARNKLFLSSEHVEVAHVRRAWATVTSGTG